MIASTIRWISLLSFWVYGFALPILAAEPLPVPLIRVAAGAFQMGEVPQKVSPIPAVVNYFQSQHKIIPTSPVHTVTLNEFEMDAEEVSNRAFQQFVIAVPTWTIAQARGQKGKADNNYLRHWDGQHARIQAHDEDPVVFVSWYAAQAFCVAQQKRLPTEAEWEKAARAGTTTPYPWPIILENREQELQNYAWFYANAQGTPHPARSKTPNPWGFYHLNGNVWEWVEDWYDPLYFQQSPRDNPPGPATGKYKVIRGGGWYDGPERLRNSSRDSVRPEYSVEDLGFRCARSLR